MREAIGGSWLLGFVVLFIVLFSGYLAVSINYSKAFKVKNQIINIVEQGEGFTRTMNDPASIEASTLKTDKSTEAQIIVTLKEAGYFTTTEFSCNDKQGDDYPGGYCLKKIKGNNGNYYKITTFIKFDLPMIDVSIKIPVSGETKTIYYDKSGND